MKNQKYSTEIFNLKSEITIHPEAIKLGTDYQPDENFIKALNNFGIYEKPIIDREGRFLTHIDEVRAAVANGLTEIEVYRVDLTPFQEKILLLLKTAYNVKNPIHSYEVAKSLKEYLEKDVEGSIFAKTIEGNINKKLASLMQTSESSIKRLIRVGDNAPEELGLIHHGEKSFKQVLDKIKLNRLEERSKIKKETENILPKQTIPITLSIPSDDETEDDVLNRNDENLPVDIPVNTVQGQNTVTATSNVSDYRFSEGSFSISNKIRFEMNVTDNNPVLKINGKELTGLSYDYFVNQGSVSASRTDTFIIRENAKDGVCIQISVKNLSKAA